MFRRPGYIPHEGRGSFWPPTDDTSPDVDEVLPGEAGTGCWTGYTKVAVVRHCG